MAEPEETYDPRDLEATRKRDQGLGVGARDIDRQRDPTRTYENRTFSDEIDPDEPAGEGMVHGADHRLREGKDEAQGQQGPKTLAAQRDQQKRGT